MNPDTNELVADFGELSKIERKGFIPIPQTLCKAARLMLGDKKRIVVSKTSGGKLSKWAIRKRKRKAIRYMIVKRKLAIILIPSCQAVPFKRYPSSTPLYITSDIESQARII